MRRVGGAGAPAAHAERSVARPHRRRGAGAVRGGGRRLQDRRRTGLAAGRGRALGSAHLSVLVRHDWAAVDVLSVCLSARRPAGPSVFPSGHLDTSGGLHGPLVL
jgi:hypothetical protein